MSSNRFNYVSIADTNLVSIINEEPIVDADSIDGITSGDLYTKEEMISIKDHVNKNTGNTIPMPYLTFSSNGGTEAKLYISAGNSYNLYGNEFDNVTVEISKSGSFTHIEVVSKDGDIVGSKFMPKLSPNTTYYARAYVTIDGRNGNYGRVITFLTGSLSGYISAPDPYINISNGILYITAKTADTISGIKNIASIFVITHTKDRASEVYMYFADDNYIVIENLLKEGNIYDIDVSVSIDGTTWGPAVRRRINYNSISTHIEDVISLPSDITYSGLLFSLQGKPFLTNLLYRSIWGNSVPDRNIYELSDKLVSTGVEHLYKGSTGPIFKFTGSNTSPNQRHVVFTTTSSENSYHVVCNNYIDNMRIVGAVDGTASHAIDNDGWIATLGGRTFMTQSIKPPTVSYTRPGVSIPSFPYAVYSHKMTFTDNGTLVVVGGWNENDVYQFSIHQCEYPYTSWDDPVFFSTSNTIYTDVCSLKDNRVLFMTDNKLYSYNTINKKLVLEYSSPSIQEYRWTTITTDGNNNVIILTEIKSRTRLIRVKVSQ